MQWYSEKALKKGTWTADSLLELALLGAPEADFAIN